MLLQLLVSGLLLGGIYALLSLGLSLMLGVSKFINFAHGDFVMVGMYMAYCSYQWFRLNPYLSWPIVAVMSIVFGGIVFFFARHTIGQTSMNQILFTLGASMILQNVALLLFKADSKSVASPFTSSIGVGDVYISQGLLITFTIAVVVTALFLCFINFTNTGRAMRAVGDDRHASYLMGIPVERIDLFTFLLGIGLACLAGALLMTAYPVTPTTSSAYTLIAWVTVVLGGLGHLQGALLSAVLIGIVENFSGFYLGADLRQAIYFLLFLVVLVVRPQGLFTGGSVRRFKKS